MANVKTDNNRYDEAVEVAVTPAMKLDIAGAAQEMGLSVSAFCRLIIKKQIEQRAVKIQQNPEQAEPSAA